MSKHKTLSQVIGESLIENSTKTASFTEPQESSTQYNSLSTYRVIYKDYFLIPPSEYKKLINPEREKLQVLDDAIKIIKTSLGSIIKTGIKNHFKFIISLLFILCIVLIVCVTNRGFQFSRSTPKAETQLIVGK